MDYRRMYDESDMLYAHDLEPAQGRDVVVVIERVFRGELTGQKNKKTKKPFVKFVGRDKKLAINKTNGKAISALYGKDTDQWIGKPIAIFATTTEFGGETVDCIRVRPYRPDPPATKSRNSGKGNEQRASQPAPQQQSAAPPAEPPADVPTDADLESAAAAGNTTYVGPDSSDPDPDDDVDDDLEVGGAS